MASEQITQNGATLGRLVSYSISDGVNSPYPTEGTGTVPNANVSVVSDDPYGLIFATDKESRLSGNYTNGHKDFFVGNLSTVSVAENSDVVSLSIDGVASKLNQDIRTLPIIPDPAYGGNNRIVSNTLIHWFAECGIHRYQHPGEMMLQIQNTAYGVGYYNHKSRRMVGYHNAPGLLTEWFPSDSTLDRGIPFGVGDKLHFGMVTQPYSFTDKLSGDFFFVEGASIPTSVPDDEGAIQSAASAPSGLYLSYTKSTQKVTITEFQSGQPNATLINATMPPNTTSVRVDLEASRTTDSRVVYTMKALARGTGFTATQTATFTRDGSYLGKRLSPSKVRHTSGNNLDYMGIDTLYVAAGDQFISDDWDADLGYTPTVMLDLKLPTDARPIVPGMAGNAWAMVNELCTLYGVVFDAQELKPYVPGLSNLLGDNSYNRAGVRVESGVREKAETVEIVNYDYRYTESRTGFIEFWRADTTYSVDRGERQEFTVQVEGGSFTSIQQPKVLLPSAVPVTKPGTAKSSYYSVYGSDNSPVTPAEWESSGGYISVAPTDTVGELKVVIQAPTETMTKAPPYIISIESSIPSLVLGGTGVVAEKKTLTAYTGAGRVPKKVGTTYDSPMVCGEWLAWGTANAVSALHGTTATTATATLLPAANAEDAPIPRVTYFRKQGAIYRVAGATRSRGSITIDSANRFTTCGDVSKEYQGLTCAQQNALFAGKTVQYNNMAPLKRYID